MAAEPSVRVKRGRAERLSLFTLILLISVAPAVFAHDMWLEAVDTKDGIFVVQTIGDGFRVVDRFQRIDRNVARAVLLTSDSTIDVLETTRAGQVLRIEKPGGAALLALERSPYRIEMRPETFREYLEEEGHEDFEFRASSPVREAFSRHLKLIFDDGTESDERILEPVGLDVELVPLVNPMRVSPGDEISFRVLIDGSPAEAVSVGYYSRDDQGEPRLTVTESSGDGIVTFQAVSSKAHQIVRFMTIRPSDEDGTDYRSRWATVAWRAPSSD